MSELPPSDNLDSSPDSPLPARTRVRRGVLQYLYARDLRKEEEDNEVHLSYFLSPKEFDPAQREFGQELAENTLNHSEHIDQFLEKYSENWDLHRMSVVDRNLLRMGVAELYFLEGTPPTVVINECVELARHLGTAESHRFINAILDRIQKQEEDLDGFANHGDTEGTEEYL